MTGDDGGNPRTGSQEVSMDVKEKIMWWIARILRMLLALLGLIMVYTKVTS